MDQGVSIDFNSLGIFHSNCGCTGTADRVVPDKDVLIEIFTLRVTVHLHLNSNRPVGILVNSAVDGYAIPVKPVVLNSDVLVKRPFQPV